MPPTGSYPSGLRHGRYLAQIASGGGLAPVNEDNNANLDRFVHPIRDQSGENWERIGGSCENLGFYFILFVSKTTEAKSGWPHPLLFVG
jgi:hypothetical protein